MFSRKADTSILSLPLPLPERAAMASDTMVPAVPTNIKIAKITIKADRRSLPTEAALLLSVLLFFAVFTRCPKLTRPPYCLKILNFRLRLHKYLVDLRGCRSGRNQLSAFPNNGISCCGFIFEFKNSHVG